MKAQYKTDATLSFLLTSGFLALIFAVMLTWLIAVKHTEGQFGRASQQTEAKAVAADRERQKALENALQIMVVERLVDRLDLVSARETLVDISRLKLDINPTDAAMLMAEAEAERAARAIEKLKKSIVQFEKIVKSQPAPPQERELLTQSKQALAVVEKQLKDLRDKIADLKHNPANTPKK